MNSPVSRDNDPFNPSPRPRQEQRRTVSLLTPHRPVDDHTRADYDAYLQRAVEDCFERNEAPLAAHLLYPDQLLSDDPGLREQALAMADHVTDALPIVVAYIDLGVSRGMQKRINRARAAGKPVIQRYLNAPGTILGTSEYTHDSGLNATPESADELEIIVYALAPEDCPNCRAVKAWLDRNDIPFTEVRIDLIDTPDPKYDNLAPREYIKKVLGYSQAPVVEVRDGLYGDHWAGRRTDKLVALKKLWKSLHAPDAAEKAADDAMWAD